MLGDVAVRPVDATHRPRSDAVAGRLEALADAISAYAQRRCISDRIQQKVDRWRSLSSPCSVEHRSNRARRVMHGGEVHIVVSHGPYQMGTQSTHPYSVLGLQPRAERWRGGHAEHHNVRLHGGWVERDSGQL